MRDRHALGFAVRAARGVHDVGDVAIDDLAGSGELQDASGQVQDQAQGAPGQVGFGELVQDVFDVVGSQDGDLDRPQLGQEPVAAGAGVVVSGELGGLGGQSADEPELGEVAEGVCLLRASGRVRPQTTDTQD